MLSRLGDRVEVLEWAQSLERPGDYRPWAKASNEAVERYLSGQMSKKALRSVAYVSDDHPYESPGEVMAYFAAKVALASILTQGILNEALSKAEEYGIRREEGEWVVEWDDEVLADPSIVDSHRWTPDVGDAEMGQWESILGKRPASV